MLRVHVNFRYGNFVSAGGACVFNFRYGRTLKVPGGMCVLYFRHGRTLKVPGCVCVLNFRHGRILKMPPVRVFLILDTGELRKCRGCLCS